MAPSEQRDAPLLQRIYDSIWWLGLAALLFWALSYAVWGLVDIFSVPAG